MNDPFEDLIARLDSVIEDLDELAFERLREAYAESPGARPDSDKTITQARRAVEKAAHLLRQLAR